MFMVVSKWRPQKGREEEFAQRSRDARKEIGAIPGVVLMHSFWNDEDGVVVIGYEDEPTYRAVVQTPGGPFDQVAQRHRLEECGEWIWSERGECVTD